MGRTPRRPPAGILIPDGIDAERWLTVCSTIAQAEAWDVIEVVHTWPQMRELLCEGRIDIGLVGRVTHLPRGWTPRLVIAEDWRPPAPPVAYRRRGLEARRLRRPFDEAG